MGAGHIFLDGNEEARDTPIAVSLTTATTDTCMSVPADDTEQGGDSERDDRSPDIDSAYSFDR